MNVSPTISTAIGNLNPAGGASSARQARGSGDPTSATSDATSTRVSGPAQLMSKLSQLRDSDPEQFTQVVSSLANQLRDAAKRDPGMGGKMLTELASKLENVANGGEISQLEPPATPEGAPHGPPPPGAAPLDGPPPGAGADLGSARSSTAASAYRSTSNAYKPGNDAGRAALSKMLDELDAALKHVGASDL